MKNNFKKFLLLTVPTLILSAIFALSVSAYTTDLMPEGAANTDPDFIPSGYSDIDENDGWLMLSYPYTSNPSDSIYSDKKRVYIQQLSDGSLSHPKFFQSNGYIAYFHERMGKLVYVVTSSSFSGNWGDEKQSDTKNSDTLGARYYQVYWNTQNTSKVKTLEFRLITSRAENYYINMNNPGYATWGLEHLDTVIFDYRVCNCNYMRWQTSPFNFSVNLVSSGHVKFNLDGSVDLDSENNTFTPGQVNLTGLKKIYSINSETGENDFAAMFAGRNGTKGKTNLSKVVMYDTLVDKDGGNASYRLPNSFFNNCIALREVIFPAELGSVGTYAFQNCSDLTLYLKGGFSDSLTFDLTSGKVSAFTGTKNITFVVNTKSDVLRLRGILDAQGISQDTVSIETTDVFEPALYPISYTARKESYNGIRGIFSFRPGIEAQNTEAGYTINEYGVIACSLAKYKSFGGTPEAVYNTTNKAIKKMIVFGPANSANKYIDRSTKTFCLTVKSIGSAYYSSELCIFAYEKWITPEGETQIFFSQITDPDNPEQHWTTLYDVTKALVDSGEVTTSSPGYTKVIKPVLDSVATLAMAPIKREDYI